MRRMSTWRQADTRWGWLLLVGGLAGCRGGTPFLDGAVASAAPGLAFTEAGSPGGEEPTTGGAPETGAIGGLQSEGAIEQRFVREGYGAATAVVSADVDGDGKQEILYAGRGIVVMGSDRSIRWTLQLPYAAPRERSTDEQLSMGAEKTRMFGVHVRAVQVGGDGSVYVLDSADRIHRVDGRTGQIAWTKDLASEGDACEIAVFDADNDGVDDLFASGGRTAYDGKTGEPLWDAGVDFVPSLVRSANLDGRPGKELILAGGAEDALPGLCPVEEKAFMEMHEGIIGGERPIRPERPSPTERPSPRAIAPRTEGGPAQVVALGADGKPTFTADNLGENVNALAILGKDAGKLQIVVGLNDGVVALDATGNEAWRADINGMALDLVPIDLDGDGANELVANVVPMGMPESSTSTTSTSSARSSTSRSSSSDSSSGSSSEAERSSLANFLVGPSTFYAIGSDGSTLWQDSPGRHAWQVSALDLDADGKDELVAGLGYADQERMKMPQAALYDVTETGAKERWRFGMHLPAHGFATYDYDGTPRLLVAGGDAVVRVVEGASGRMVDGWYAGAPTHAIAAGDLDGDGNDEIVTGDIFGALAVTRSDGTRGRTTRFALQEPVAVTGIDIRAPQGRNPGLFVAAGFAWRGDDIGTIEAYDTSGKRLFRADTPNGLGDPKFADLDGDGEPEIVAAYYGFRLGEGMGGSYGTEEGSSGREGSRGTETSSSGRESSGRDSSGRDSSRGAEPSRGAEAETCGVAAWDLDGTLRWQAPIGNCDFARIAVGDVNGDGIDEVAYAEFGKSGPFNVALVDGDGKPAWTVSNDTDDGVWIAVVGDGIAYGGRSGIDSGHATLLDARDGSERWRTDVRGQAEGFGNPEESPFGAFSGTLFGTRVGDLDGDRVDDLAYSTAAGDVVAVSSKDGSPVFMTSLLQSMPTEPGAAGASDGTTSGGVSGGSTSGGVTSGRTPASHTGTASKTPSGTPSGGEPTTGSEPAIAPTFAGGPIAWVERENGGYIVATGYEPNYVATELLAIDEKGEVIGGACASGLAAGVAPAAWKNGQGVAFGTTFDTYALDIGEKAGISEPHPRPSKPPVRPSGGGYGRR